MAQPLCIEEPQFRNKSNGNLGSLVSKHEKCPIHHAQILHLLLPISLSNFNPSLIPWPWSNRGKLCSLPSVSPLSLYSFVSSMESLRHFQVKSVFFGLFLCTVLILPTKAQELAGKGSCPLKGRAGQGKAWEVKNQNLL